MKRKHVGLATGLAVVILVGSFWTYDYFAGNHVEIENVLSTRGQAAQPASATQADLNGNWAIQEASRVYFSVTTSLETVNFALDKVQGNWYVDLANPSKMSAEGKVDMNAINSGNTKRDSHLKDADYFDIAKHAQASFTAKSFENVPTSWTEGRLVPLKIAGTLDVRGISKDVTFTTDALYENGELKLSGQTVVTFEDFGLKNPHAVVVSTENDITVRLELVLKRV